MMVSPMGAGRPFSPASGAAPRSTATGAAGAGTSEYATVPCRAAGRAPDPDGTGAGSSPETYADLNRTSVVVSIFRYARPGTGGSSYASGTPSTARLSGAEKVRSPIR